MVQPRCKMDRKLSVDFVNGKKNDIHCRVLCIPSTGHIIPHNITMGKKLPRAMYVADRSLSQQQETTKPKK